MKRTDVFTKMLALAGMVVVWMPILSPFVFTRWGALGTEHFHFDWLMPAELFPAALLGGVILLWAAVRAHSRRALVGWGLGLAVGLLVAGMVLAQVTGLASGDTEPTGLAWALVVASLVLYSAAVVEMGVAGVMLVRDLFARRQQTPPTSAT
ncbi:MAG: hypothetical protein HGA39_05620 [Coriobacteriia bacterium]|nr:hypothetical protein [Coriobacteriia bacterium]